MTLQTLIWLFLLPVSGISLIDSDPVDINLNDYKWENRILLLFSDDNTDKLYQQQLSLLNYHRSELDERDLILISVFEEGGSSPDGNDISRASAKQLKDSYRTMNQPFTFILIGKDGGVKLKSNEVVLMDDLFGRIDSMPMRRQEMRGR